MFVTYTQLTAYQTCTSKAVAATVAEVAAVAVATTVVEQNLH